MSSAFENVQDYDYLLAYKCLQPSSTSIVRPHGAPTDPGPIHSPSSPLTAYPFCSSLCKPTRCCSRFRRGCPLPSAEQTTIPTCIQSKRHPSVPRSRWTCRWSVAARFRPRCSSKGLRKDARVDKNSSSQAARMSIPMTSLGTLGYRSRVVQRAFLRAAR